MVRIPYLEECIDTSSKYGKKYMELVSSADTVLHMDVHHIVPVSYYQDVLGVKPVRQAGSPDMDQNNLVPLSKGRHLIAHYYLSRCARDCIKVQAITAFRLMYDNREDESEECVLKVAKEMDKFYKSIKSKKLPQKDGVKIIQHATGISRTEWKDGNKVGYSAMWNHDGVLCKCTNHDNGLDFSWGCWKNGERMGTPPVWKYSHSISCYGRLSLEICAGMSTLVDIFDDRIHCTLSKSSGATQWVDTLGNKIYFGAYSRNGNNYLNKVLDMSDHNKSNFTSCSGIWPELFDLIVSLGDILRMICPVTADHIEHESFPYHKLKDFALAHNGKKLDLVIDPIPDMPKRTKKITEKKPSAASQSPYRVVLRQDNSSLYVKHPDSPYKLGLMWDAAGRLIQISDERMHTTINFSGVYSTQEFYCISFYNSDVVEGFCRDKDNNIQPVGKFCDFNESFIIWAYRLLPVLETLPGTKQLIAFLKNKFHFNEMLESYKDHPKVASDVKDSLNRFSWPKVEYPARIVDRYRNVWKTLPNVA